MALPEAEGSHFDGEKLHACAAPTEEEYIAKLESCLESATIALRPFADMWRPTVPPRKVLCFAHEEDRFDTIENLDFKWAVKSRIEIWGFLKCKFESTEVPLPEEK